MKKPPTQDGKYIHWYALQHRIAVVFFDGTNMAK